MTILLTFLAVTAFAADKAVNTDDIFNELVPNTAPAATVVERELECVRLHTDDGREMIKSRAASEMIHRLAPYMEDGFKAFKFSLFEKAAFYAQSIEESGGFTQLAEAGKRKSYAREGADPIGHMISIEDNNGLFEQKKGAVKSRQFGVFRGRGLVMISRCDNYLSTAHYLNDLYSGKPPAWKTYWEIKTGKDPKTKKDIMEQIGTVCSEKELKAYKDQYLMTYKRNANIYGVLEDPMRFAMIGWELTDPVTKKKMASEKFMVDASIAFWRGKCADHVDHAMDQKKLATFDKCAEFKGPYMDWAAKCLTKCIKGSTEGWERRAMWMKRALLCGR